MCFYRIYNLTLYSSDPDKLVFYPKHFVDRVYSSRVPPSRQSSSAHDELNDYNFGDDVFNSPHTVNRFT